MTTVSETPVEGGGYEQRYSIDVLKYPMHFVRRPVSIEPKEGTVAYVDNGPRLGVIPLQSAGVFEGGKWKKVRFEPTHWTTHDDR